MRPEGGDIEQNETLVANFPMPDDCAPGGTNTELSCSTGKVLLAPVALTMAGEAIPQETSITQSGTKVSAQSTSPESPAHVITMYAAPKSQSGALDVAAETFTWMVAADAQQAGGTQPLENEEEGEWSEEESAGEAGSEEIGEEWEPADDEFESPPVVLPVGPLELHGSFKRPKQVKVPSNYVYCVVWVTNKCRPKNLHDYCSWSPDSFTYTVPRSRAYKTSFKGPCARHDLSIDSIRKKSISVSKKRSQRANADKTFRSHLRQNCGYGLYMTTKGRTKCYDRASTYYSAVSNRTKDWNGK